MDNSAPRSRRPERHLAERPETWLLLAGTARSLAEHAEAIRDLASARHRVRLGYTSGPLPTGLPRGRHRLLTQERVAGVPTRRASAAVTALVPPSARMRLAGRYDRWLAHVTPSADHVVFLDDEVRAALGPRVEELAPRARVWDPEQAGDALREEGAWRTLLFGARRLDVLPLDANRSLSRVLDPARILLDPHEGSLPGSGPTRLFDAVEVRPELRRLVRWCVRKGRYAPARQLLLLADEIRARRGPDPVEDAALDALATHLDLIDGTAPAASVPDLVRPVLEGADAALARADLRDASELVSVALGLMFHQQLHVAVESTPLVTDTEAFLAPWRRSRVGTLLGGPPASRPVRTTPEHDPAAAPGSGRTRVTVLPGLYDNHAVPLLRALDQDDRVALSTVSLKTGAFGGLMIDVPVVQHRLERALGTQRVSGPGPGPGQDEEEVPPVEPVPALGLSPDDEHALAAADVVVADWADKGCVWASTSVPDGTRLVVRIHSVDMLSAPAHLVDWSRVDDVVFVSEHIRDLFVQTFGERAGRARLHVVTNIVPLSDFPDPTLPDASRTLGVVGWAQQVKDPLFALEVLALLAAEDDRWRLRLVGSDFGPTKVAAVEEYAAAFRRRALAPDLVDRVDYTGFTRELPRHLRHVGFVLSTSLRESCPVGALEGVAAGAYPVVRDWPTFAPLDGARRLFPEECVVTTPQEAAERIRALADEADRRTAVDRIHELMKDQFSDTHTRGRLLEIILGGHDASPSPTTEGHP